MTTKGTVHAIPLLAAAIRLTAVPTAVPYARMFVRHTLGRWQLDEHTDTAALIMSELVTNALRASGVDDEQPKACQITSEHVIGAQLCAIAASLYVEVWDRAEEAPVRKNPGPDVEGGRGLVLVEGLAKCWDVYRPYVGGKVVWAELPLTVPVVSLPSDLSDPVHRPLVLQPGVRAPHGPVEFQARRALLDRLSTTTILADMEWRGTGTGTA